jgi:hypothetical protein
MEKICANAVCWVTPSELGIPEISAPSHHSLGKKRHICQEHSSSRVLPYTNKFCSKIPTERKGHQKFNNMKKLASNQGGYYHILKARNGTPNI